MILTCKVDSSKILSYARMQNGLKAVNRLVLSNKSTEDLHEVTVKYSSDPGFAYGRESHIGMIPAGGKVAVDEVDIQLSADYLANLSEITSGVLKIEAVSGDTPLMSETVPMKILPYDYWEGMAVSPEMLAAFVVPSHPEVKRILKAASEKLARWTGDSSLDEYQKDSSMRVKFQMAAIYEAIRDLKVTYATPPASFHETGQRVRLPEEICATGLATCLDSALLYASCLEAAGIHPILVINSSHAYAGGWLSDMTAPAAVNDDISLLSKSNADGINDLVLVETTCSDDGRDMSFDGAVHQADLNLLSPEDFCCFLDVTTARNLGILPLPLRVVTESGYMIEEQTGAAGSGRPDSLPERDEIDIDADSDRTVDKQTIWERKLLDLSTRNNLLKIHPYQVMQLLPPDLQTMMEALQNGVSLTVTPYPDLWDTMELVKGFLAPSCQADLARSFATAEIRSGFIHSFMRIQDTAEWMHDLRLEAKHSLEENGANTLYLTCGSVHWISEDTGKECEAPLILIPVEFTKGRGGLTMTEEGPVINKTLLEMMRQRFGINVPGLDPLPEKDGFVDVRLVQNTLRHAIMDRKGWDVEDYVFLGTFTFNKFIIWNDIHSNQDLFDRHPVVKSIKSGVLDPSLARTLDEEGTIDELCPADQVLLPISADSSQLKAIHDAMSGRSFVMHGPPGTGKSQTITNIIANALYHGKRVLFVSEKKAALDVVHSRLESIGLAPYSLELHSNKARKSAVLAKIESALSTERMQEPESFAAEAEGIMQMRRMLDSHAEGLHKDSFCGRTLYDCISGYLAMPEDIPSRRLPAGVMHGLTASSLKEMETAVGEFAIAARHTGINGGCGLLDLPLYRYSAGMEEELTSRMENLLGKKSNVSFYLECRKFQQYLGTDIGASFAKEAIEALREKVARWLGSIGELRRYAIYNDRRAALMSRGLAFVAEEYEAGKIEADRIEDCFRKSAWRSMAEHIMSDRRDLNLFSGEMFEARIERYRGQEKAFMDTVRKQLQARMSKMMPDLDAEAVNDPEVAVLKKALRNNARGISLRTLFDRIPTLLPRICPCMLMSPLSVSQYLQPAPEQFDIVIFDEASQMQTCEAIASIARGRALVVVGDPRQLPPTAFFETSSFDEENAAVEDQESILDECLAVSLPSNHLRWHYRSRHESLIAFSNANYYENRLLTFPSNDDITGRVSFVKVEGEYDRGRTRQNVAEAKAVADEVCRRLEAGDGRSIGVIAFSAAQQNAIEKCLEARFAKDKRLARKAQEGDEPMFVKSLENVQGDERDVILFSVGYGRDRKGHVSTNFGPVNQTGGWRRLNVAFSRSRDEMVIFSSIEPEEIHVDFKTVKGVCDLRAFLEYAKNGRAVLEERKAASGAGTDLYARMIADSLRKEGYTVNEAVGTSDFRVDLGIVDPEDPGRYLYGIILDGKPYASAEAARDRELTRMDLLKGLGWDIRRKWILDSYGIR